MKGNILITLLVIAIVYFTLVFLGTSARTAALCVLMGVLLRFGRQMISKYKN